MKILKLLPTMLLLNCIVPSPEAKASGELGSVLLYYMTNHPKFFIISFADFKEQISNGLQNPLSDGEITDFETNYYRNEEYKKSYSVSGSQQGYSVVDVTDVAGNHNMSIKDILNPDRVEPMSKFYSYARQDFFLDYIADAILSGVSGLPSYEDIKEEIQKFNRKVYCCDTWKEDDLEFSLKWAHYTENRINEIIYLTDCFADMCHESTEYSFNYWKNGIWNSISSLVSRGHYRHYYPR